MAGFGWNRQTVRPTPPARISSLLCLVVLVLSAAAVYVASRIYTADDATRQPFTATAYITERSGTSTSSTNAAQQQPVSVSASDPDPRRAVDQANNLANQQANQLRTDWQNAAERRLSSARQTAERAAQEFREKTDALAAIKQQASEAAPPKPVASAVPAEIANPARTPIEQQIAELEQRKAKLLINLTDAHPAVQEVADKLTDARAQLAQIPATIPNPKAALAAQNQQPPAAESQPQIDAQKLEQLTAAVETARRANEAAQLALNQAVQARRNEPQFAIQYAEVPPPNPTAFWNQLRLLATLFSSAVMMSFGVGLTWLGVRIQPPAQTVQQLEADLLVPVVGILPSDRPSNERAAEKSGRRGLTIGLGLLLCFACPAVAAWAMLAM